MTRVTADLSVKLRGPASCETELLLTPSDYPLGYDLVQGRAFDDGACHDRHAAAGAGIDVGQC